MWIKLLPVTMMLLLMSGCLATPVQNDLGCVWIKPIDTNAADRKVIPKPVKLQIAQHNEMYDLKCGVLK